MFEIVVGHRRVCIVSEPIQDLGDRYDALVSSDDNHLSHGGGVSRALWLGAGPELAEHVREERPVLRLGDVYRTPAFRLRADHLLHAVTIDFDANRRLGAAGARDLFGRVIDEAAALGCRGIAFPLLGAGAAQLAPATVARAAAEAIDERAATASSLERIALVALGPDAGRVARVFRTHLRERAPLESLLAGVSSRAGASGERLLASWTSAVEAGRTGDPAAALLLLEPVFQVLLDRGLEAARSATLDPDLEKRVRRLPGGALVPAEDRERMSPGALVLLAKDLLASADRPVPQELLGACLQAVEARNQLAHGPPVDPAALQRTILRAVEGIVDWLAAETAPQHDLRMAPRTEGGALPAALERGVAAAAAALPSLSIFNGLFDSLRSSRPPNHVPRARTGQATVDETARPTSVSDLPSPFAAEAAPSGVPGATRPARRLRDFLWDELAPGSREALVKSLRADGHVGQDRAILLEFCVREEDPIGYLASEFRAEQLREFLQRYASRPARPGARAPELARDLLESFGFTVPTAPRGLRTALCRLRQLRRAAPAMGILELKGAVTEGASHVEYVIHVLLRFLCQAVYQEPPELHFRDRLDNGRPVSRQSLGKLGELLESLAEELRRDTSPRAVQFERDFATDRLAPEGGLGGLPQLRNAFAHFDREMLAVPLDEARRLAGDFLKLAVEFLEYLGRRESRVFPLVVRIERLQVDRWGRRIIEAVSDEEDPDELIFTDRQLVPGQLYFMHPLSNPLRVDPILVPAGDLEERGQVTEPGRRQARASERARRKSPG